MPLFNQRLSKMLLSTIAALWVGSAAAIWPLPATLQTGNQALWIRNSVNFVMPPPQYGLNQTILELAVADTRNTIFNQNFVPWKFHKRNTDFTPSASANSINTVKLVYGPSTASPEKEGAYSLDVTREGKVTITAPTAIGLKYGLNTFSQLFYQSYDGGIFTDKAPVHIIDSPKYEHRGLMLDVGRSYYPVKDILRQIDGLAFSKMNKLHLHMTDSQSWPLVIPSVPEISAKGAYAPHMVYTPADFELIQVYGEQRGVDVITEIDMPGHIASLVWSHPDIIGGWDLYPYYKAALEPPSGVLNIDEPKATNLIHRILDDVLSRVKSKYYHSGGDEVLNNAFLYDPTLNTSSQAVIQPIMQKFVTAIHDQVRSHGKTPYMWHDGLIAFNLTVGKDVIVQSWDANNVSLVAALDHGLRAIVSPGSNWYLDCGQGEWGTYLPSQISSTSDFTDYCSPKKNWQYMYLYNPLTSTTPENEHLVIGGEAVQWTELTDAATVDGSVWPRAAVVGEVLWSGNYPNGQLRDLTTVSPRLAEIRERLVARGIAAEALHMPFCTQDEAMCLL